MSTTVRVTETYDLKTTVNKIGLIGVHTPDIKQIAKLYPGLIKNHRFIRVLSCDVVGACASVLPADPLQVGVESGDVAPEDMFNPILYKAVSNESFDTLVNRIYNGTQNSVVNSVVTDELDTNAFDVYYAQLADSDRWKKAMPQRGFSMRGLYPICYTVVNTFGNIRNTVAQTLVTESEEDDTIGILGLDTVDQNNGNGINPIGTTFKGPSLRMPRIPLHTYNESLDGFYEDATIPKTFVMAILVPPARLNEFYYRMRVSWTIKFEDVCSTLEYASLSGMATVGQVSHYANFSGSRLAPSNSALDSSEDMVDTNDVSIKKIMES